MKRSRGPQIGLDSQCLSYLLDAIAGIEEPTDVLAPEKKALIRSWFYRPGNFAYTLTATVVAEVRAISNTERRELHESFIRTLFLDYPVSDSLAIQERAAYFAMIHPGLRDCRILAESEELGLDLVLTYDHDFWRRLRYASPTTKLVKPSEYWASLGVPEGVAPQTVPHPTNPLSSKSWWRW